MIDVVIAPEGARYVHAELKIINAGNAELRLRQVVPIPRDILRLSSWKVMTQCQEARQKSSGRCWLDANGIEGRVRLRLSLGTAIPSMLTLS
jgi:hypothetical protein